MNEAWLVNDAIPCEGVNASACIERWSKTNGPTNRWTDRLTKWCTNKVMDRTTDEATKWWTSELMDQLNKQMGQWTNKLMGHPMDKLTKPLMWRDQSKNRLTNWKSKESLKHWKPPIHHERTEKGCKDQQLSCKGLAWSILAMGWDRNSILTLISSWFWFLQSNFKINPSMTRLC